MDDQAFIAAHVEAISGRTRSDGQRLFSAILGRSWPGGSSDRSEPSALEWVRRWGPSRHAPALFDCSCAMGRCRLCN